MSEKLPPKSDDYQPERRNAQGEHDGSKHTPDEFDIMNPAKQVESPDTKKG